MTHTALVEVLERASVDATFRARIQSDPQDALAGYDLTAEERLAIIRGDSASRPPLGVDSRVTKMSDTPTLPQGDDLIGFS
jgi:hypothetical protein